MHAKVLFTPSDEFFNVTELMYLPSVASGIYSVLEALEGEFRQPHLDIIHQLTGFTPEVILTRQRERGQERRLTQAHFTDDQDRDGQDGEKARIFRFIMPKDVIADTATNGVKHPIAEDRPKRPRCAPQHYQKVDKKPNDTRKRRREIKTTSKVNIPGKELDDHRQGIEIEHPNKDELPTIAFACHKLKESLQPPFESHENGRDVLFPKSKSFCVTSICAVPEKG